MKRDKKHIYIYSPSGAVRDKAAFRRGVARLTALGYEVEVDTAALSSHQRFAGDDATRLAAIDRACDSGADIALISRGGYGLTRILPGIRYKKVAKAIGQGTQFVGISDFTAFQNALLAQTGARSWAGPGLCEGFGMSGYQDKKTGAPALQPNAVMEACFHDLVTGQGQGAGWRLPRLDGTNTALKESATWQVGDAVLWGGNLSVFTGLLGTPYFPDVRAGILFLEDVAEHPYRIERMLTQLLYAGVLQRQKAVLLGQFTGYQTVAHDRGFRLQSVVEWLRQQIPGPVLSGLPYGHVTKKVLLPVGAKTDLIVQNREAWLLWGHG
jgi:muramoyltetrapeptide carboxypeptidase